MGQELDVLILVIVEYSMWEAIMPAVDSAEYVLILVIVEYSMWGGANLII